MSRPKRKARLPEAAGLRKLARTRGLLLGLFRSRGRLGVVVLRFRIEELAGGGNRLGGRIAVLVAGRDVLAAVDALGLVLAARNRDGDLDLDLGMNGDG